MAAHLGLQQLAALALFLGMIPVFLLSVMWRPIVGIFYVVPLLPLQMIRFRMHDYPLGKSFVEIILLGVLIGLALRGRLSILKHPLGALIVLIALYTYLSLWKSSLMAGFPLPLWFDDLRVSMWKNHVIVPLLVFVCAVSSIETVKDMKILLLLMALTIGVLNRQQYSNARYHTFSRFDYTQRAEGHDNGLGSNELGALEAQCCIFLMGMRACEKRRLWRLGYLAFAGLSAYCVMVSFSRGAYVALLVGWAFVAIVKERKLGILLIVFLITWQAIVPAAVVDRIFMTYDESTGEFEGSTANRLSLWDDALEAIEQEPAFGAGYCTYMYLSKTGWHDCHNFYIKLVFELGIVGLAIFLTLFWRLISLGCRLFRAAADPFLSSIGLGLACWMVCACVANVFGDRWNYVQITGYLWAIAACVVRGLAITAERAETVEPDPEAAELTLSHA